MRRFKDRQFVRLAWSPDAIRWGYWSFPSEGKKRITEEFVLKTVSSSGPEVFRPRRVHHWKDQEIPFELLLYNGIFVSGWHHLIAETDGALDPSATDADDLRLIPLRKPERGTGWEEAIRVFEQESTLEWDQNIGSISQGADEVRLTLSAVIRSQMRREAVITCNGTEHTCMWTEYKSEDASNDAWIREIRKKDKTATILRLANGFWLDEYVGGDPDVFHVVPEKEQPGFGGRA